MRWKIFFILLSAIFLMGLASAEFAFSDGGSSITTEYGTSKYLKANINISFQNESLESVFQDSLGNFINISFLLTRIPAFDYELNLTFQTITSEFHVIPFDNANFSMPNVAGNITYQLNFSGEEIFNQEIKISSEGNSVEEKINEKYEELNKLKEEINKFDFSTKRVLNEELNVTYIESKIEEIENQYELASSEQYEEILQNLSDIKIPIALSETKSANLITFYPKRENINLYVLQSLTEGEYEMEKEGGYLDAIYIWNGENLITYLTFREISMIYSLDEMESLKIFIFEFDKRELKNNAYFIIEDLGDIKFYGNYFENEQNEYISISLSDISNEIILSTKQEVDFLDVPVFISPSLNDLTPVEVGIYTPYRPNTSKWFLFGLIVFLLIIIGITAYISLQIWYKRRYENYLFKNRNNLFNIMTYIQNAKKRSLPREEIIKNLRKAKWRKEQINYAMNKYEGKKIAGIIERPFKKSAGSVERYPKKGPIYHTKV